MTTAAAHNGGRTQVNTNFLLNGGEFPFINGVLAAASLAAANGANTPITPDMLDTNGWPTSNTNALGVACGGISFLFFVPPQTSRSGNYVATWSDSGAHTVTLGFTQTLVSGSLTSSGGAGRYVFTPASNRFSVSIPAGISNLKIFHASDETDLNNGEVFTADFKARIAEGKFGVIRFLNWLGGLTAGTNNANLTNWSSRKPTTYWSYCNHELRSSIFAGVTTNTGNAYSASRPTIHSSDGTAWGVGDQPKDQDIVHVVFNASASAAPCTLDVGSTGTAINILNWYGGALSSSYYPVAGTASALATLTYDAVLGAWVKYGAGAGEGAIGLRNGVPPEICFRLCAETGTHPHWVSPHQGAHQPSDWNRQLAIYCAANQPSWMIPRYEGPNELWNFGTNCTQYALSVAAAYGWGVDYHNWYGRVMSLLGQDVAAAYSIIKANVKTQTKYQVLCGVQTGYGDSTIDAATHNPRLASTNYLLQTAPTGYAKDAASDWTTHICPAQYWAPTDRRSNKEISDAYTYALSGFATASLPQGYLDGAVTGGGSINIPSELLLWQRWKTWAQGFGIQKMCGYEGGYSPDYVGAGVNLSSPTAPYMPITGATAANPCVLSVPNTCFEGTFTLSNTTTGSTVVGMAIRIQSHGGTQGTFLNNPSETVTFTGGGSANINGANTLRVNQAVWFSTTGTLPSELSQINLPILTNNGSTYTTKPYYVVSAGNPFQISATKGGAAITFNSTTSGTITAQEGWFITAVGSGTVTIDGDSTTAGAFTSGGQAAHASGDIIINRYRYAGKQIFSTTAMGTGLLGYTALLYNNWANLSDGTFTSEFPSCFQLGGSTPSATVWSVLEDLYQTPNPPQFEAIRLYNNRKRRLVW